HQLCLTSICIFGHNVHCALRALSACRMKIVSLNAYKSDCMLLPNNPQNRRYHSFVILESYSTGHTGRYIKALFSTSLIFLLAHVSFQICLYTIPSLDNALGHNFCGCSCRLPLEDPWSMVWLLTPDLGIFIISLITLILCNRLLKKREEGPIPHMSTLLQEKHLCREYFGSNFKVHLGFNALCVMVAFFTGGHLVCLYLYQSSFAQDMFSPVGLWARLFGLKAIIKPGNCSSFDININTQHDWPVYVNPGILFLLYISVTIVLKINSYSLGHTDKVLSHTHLFNYRDNSPQNYNLFTLFSNQLMSRPSGEATADNPLRLVGRMILQQSYICALIAMMVWSITYHSWLTFVLLLWSCVIWMLRARQRFATLCSPFILLYGFTLCCLQYVWAMDLETELPQHIGTMSLRQLGLDRAQYPCLRLGAMLLFTLTFWLLLRQSVKDMFSRKKRITAPLQEVTTGESTGRNESILKVFGGLVMSLYAKYWIYVCGGMFIMVSFAGKLVAYKIVYMLLFLLCLCLYQVYYSLWRRLLKAFWWMVVAYTMVVLIAIYTFQFEDFPGYWGNFTGFTEQQLTDMGLETFKLSELFTSIVIPGFFLLACILQLHYFHKPFMKITDLENVTPIHRHENFKLNIGQYSYGCQHTPLILVCILFSEVIPSKWGLVMDRVMVLSRKFSDTLTHVQSFIWRVLELHIVKIVAYFVVWVALLEPSAMNLVLVVLWSFAMPYGRFRAMASCLSTIWVCVIIVCKMLYQLSVVNTAEYSNNCTVPMVNETSLELDEVLNSTLYKAPVDPANWFGVRKDATILGYTKDHLLVLMLLVFEATVYRHQIHHYRQQQRSPPPIPVIFPQATRDTLDKGLLHCIKYLLNYSFYKFGLEICFLMTVNVIGQRMNFLVIIHGCWLVAIMVQRRRAAIAKIWSKYCLFLVVFMVYQYVLCVGIPPALCIDYPWRWRTSVTIHSALVKWIYLPDFYTIPNSRNLISDFLLLMCASQQWAVFENEKKEEWMVMGGENKDNPDPMEDMLFNPAPNFINCRSYLDMAKVLVFRYMFWFVLSVLFVTGATRISVFGLGYLMACFFFLLFGTRLLIKPSRTRLVLWDCLIMYNVAVIISKNILSILACVFVLEMQKNFCWVIQLFSLVCTVKGYYDRKFCTILRFILVKCSLPVEEAGIIWDSICFFFLLLQRRVFLSFYFLHVSADLQASARQASRGFELFRASIIKNMHFYQQAEKKSIQQLKESGEEDESFQEEQKPRQQTAFQLAYQAWVTSAKEALTDRQLKQREQRAEAKKQQTSQATATGSDIMQRILDILKFLWVLFLAMVDGFTMWLNLLTKQYVDTSMVLSEERYLFIHNISQVGNSLKQTLSNVLLALINSALKSSVMHKQFTIFIYFHISHYVNKTSLLKRSNKINSFVLQFVQFSYFLCMLYFRPFSVEELIQSGEFYSSQNRLLKLLFALYNVLAAHSELVCYFIIVLNNLVTASVISLVLPILVFLWAMLSVPRPSKRFWMTAIIYTEVMVVVKYLFQFGFFPWNTEYELKLNEDKPFFPPRILGLEKTDNYIRYDLLQLLVLFFHRSLLQRYGLWDQEGPLEEKSNLSSAEKNKNERDEKVFQLSDEEDSRAQPEADTEVLSMTPSTETPTDAEIQTDPEPNIQTDTTETLDTVKADGKKKSRFLRFRKKKQSEKGLLGKKKDYLQYITRYILYLNSNVYKPTCGFFQNILHAEYRAATDVYALMFLTDVVDFIIIVFGFWAFGKHSAAADIASSLSEDQVPEAFLVMLLIQFSTMIIDRALYLRKSILGKLIFQVILVFGIHLWMFFILPAVTERMFNHNSVAQLWYFFKCIYFTLSAYQIRCGYPTRILGNFLTKKFNHLNLFLFQGFRLVPFLVELRAVMDWVWTDTTLSLSNWMCVEDIYANIFIIKCSRETEKKYPQPKGQKKKKIVKYGMGGLIILFLICIIWFPLLFISLVKSVVGVVNHPVDVTVTVRLGGYEPLFTMSVQQQSIQPFAEQDYNHLANLFGKNAVAMQFITMYSYEDIVTANIEGSSGSVWRISPPSRQELIKELLGSTGDMTLRLDWNFQRDLGKGGTVEHTFDKHSISLSPKNPVRADLASLLLGTRKDPVHVPHMFPNYIRAPTGAEAKPVSQLYEGDEEGYQNVTLSLMREASVNTTGAQEWWDISIADCRGSCGVLPMVIFNDKVSPPSLGFLAGYGIMGLYVSVVLVIGKFVRGFFSEISHSIMFEELPCVDRILKLCMDIFLVRETGELELEEEIYSKLIFLYRSPETMIKWTREKNED
uniref:Piezo-type mechanosensitive ion channel component 1-like n=1 Tax=Sinocyclocheilus rhinocerous TaxID=307959 RepID=A0A673G972_9TELE